MVNVEAARFFARDKKRERRSERAHCGYGVFIHWYQVTRFRPLDRSRKRPTRLSLPIKMPRPLSLSTSLYLSLSSFSLGTASKAPWRGRTARKKKRNEKIKNRPVYLFADTGCRDIPTGLMRTPPLLFFMSRTCSVLPSARYRNLSRLDFYKKRPNIGRRLDNPGLHF